ncbi:MAG: hypothetical protein JRG86_06775 [Deltaproteobacteria bacterium]|nr:hypothetical protein [Deltaproteobacteria bacterium]MBW2496007.1 hypothetical protein [Deltaproteobacteria bacterium]
MPIHRVWIRRSPLALVLITALFVPGAACTRSEVKGNYAIRLELAGSPRPFDGTLILATAPLDIPTRSTMSPEIDSEILIGDAMGANSCFVLNLASPEGDEGPLVRIFEARISPSGEVAMPIEIVRAAGLTIQITSLQFFSSALGGELEIEVDGQIRPGNIFGERTGPPQSQNCVEAVERLRASFEDLGGR